MAKMHTESRINSYPKTLDAKANFSKEAASKTVGTNQGAKTALNHTCAKGGAKPAACCN